MTSRGEPDRSTGPLVRFPAPVIVVLSSSKVVSDALYLVRYVSLTASADAFPPGYLGVQGIQPLFHVDVVPWVGRLGDP